RSLSPSTDPTSGARPQRPAGRAESDRRARRRQCRAPLRPRHQTDLRAQRPKRTTESEGRAPRPCFHACKASPQAPEGLTCAAELHPDQPWPVQLTDEIREMIHRANQAPERGLAALPGRVRALGPRGIRAAVALGLAHTARLQGDTRPGARKTHLLPEAFRDREDDFLRFATDLRIPPTSAAESTG